MATSQQRWRHESQLPQLAAALALVLLLAAENADAVCDENHLNCDTSNPNCETNISIDNDNCGGCGNRCPDYPNAQRRCISSKCTPLCDSNFGNCDNNDENGCEQDVGSDVNNCGICGHQCVLKSEYSPNGFVICHGRTCESHCNPGFEFSRAEGKCVPI